MCGPHECSCYGGRHKQLGMVIMPYAGFDAGELFVLVASGGADG